MLLTAAQLQRFRRQIVDQVWREVLGSSNEERRLVSEIVLRERGGQGNQGEGEGGEEEEEEGGEGGEEEEAGGQSGGG